MEALRRPLPPFWFFVSLILMTALHVLASGPRWLDWPWRGLGGLPLALGLLLILWANALFAKHDTEVKPFRESSALITEGPFRVSRNPMYLGGMLVFLGVAMLFGTCTPCLVLPVAFVALTRMFIEPEEQAMERQFGDAFRAYAGRVRRWI
jgi:protein-S-isoprenylcysteine O-methyltransferase Ste14